MFIAPTRAREPTAPMWTFTSLPDLYLMALTLICPHVKPESAARYLLCLQTRACASCWCSHTHRLNILSTITSIATGTLILRALQGLLQLLCICVRISRPQQAAVGGLTGTFGRAEYHSSCFLTHCSANHSMSAFGHSSAVSRASIYPHADTSIFGIR